VSCKAGQHKKLERLCRYVTRPAISEQRLSIAGNGHVIYELKTPYSDGTTHVVLSPLEFIGRLAALVPKPRVNLTRFHGVFSRLTITLGSKHLQRRCQQSFTSVRLFRIIPGFHQIWLYCMKNWTRYAEESPNSSKRLNEPLVGILSCGGRSKN